MLFFKAISNCSNDKFINHESEDESEDEWNYINTEKNNVGTAPTPEMPNNIQSDVIENENALMANLDNLKPNTNNSSNALENESEQVNDISYVICITLNFYSFFSLSTLRNRIRTKNSVRINHRFR